VPDVDELSCELALLNAGPDGGVEWRLIHCRTPCDRLYNRPLRPLPVDAVTHDSASSAYYRYVFELPVGFVNAVLEGYANVDDQGVALLNGARISGLIGCDTWGDTPVAPPTWAPPFPATDGFGDRILTSPLADPFGTSEQALFLEGENELVFAVSGDSSAFDPTGLEFVAVVQYAMDDCVTDSDGDGVVDCQDRCWGYDDAADADADGRPDACDRCAYEPALTFPDEPTFEASCGDNVDNDCDGWIDEADDDCAERICVGLCGDFNGDFCVNLFDFNTFAVCYGLSMPTPDCPAHVWPCTDLDGDGLVNLIDFATFAVRYLDAIPQSPPNCLE
jgi:hypothetical protein